MSLRLWILFAVLTAFFSSAQAQERRLAFIVGNGQYQSIDPLATPLQDLRLVRDSLRRAGFAVTEGANLDEKTLRRQFREFARRVDEAGTDAVAFVYLTGYALLSDGANYFLPVDIRLEGPESVTTQGLSMDDVLNALAGTPARLRVLMVDGARIIPNLDEQRFGAPGLGAVLLPEQAVAVLSAQPGSVIVDGERDRNSPFATAFAKHIAAPGLNAEEALRQIRCEVHNLTENQQIPWSSSTFTGTVFLGDPRGRVAEDACEPIDERVAARRPPTIQTYVPVPRERPRGTRITRDRLRQLSPDEAYAAAIEDGSIDAYNGFVEVYPSYPRAYRFRERLDARIETELWLRAAEENTAGLYDAYLRRFPYGSYRRQALARLERFGARAPDLPPPPRDYYDRRRPRAVSGGPGYFPPPRPSNFFIRPERDRERDREELGLYALERQREDLDQQYRREQRPQERTRLERQLREFEERLRRERDSERDRLDRARAELEDQLRREQRQQERERIQRQRAELEERIRQRQEREGLEKARAELEDQLRREQRQQDRERIQRQREELEKQLRDKRETRVRALETLDREEKQATPPQGQTPSAAVPQTPQAPASRPGAIRETPPQGQNGLPSAVPETPPAGRLPPSEATRTPPDQTPPRAGTGRETPPQGQTGTPPAVRPPPGEATRTPPDQTPPRAGTGRETPPQDQTGTPPAGRLPPGEATRTPPDQTPPRAGTGRETPPQDQTGTPPAIRPPPGEATRTPPDQTPPRAGTGREAPSQDQTGTPPAGRLPPGEATRTPPDQTPSRPGTGRETPQGRLPPGETPRLDRPDQPDSPRGGAGRETPPQAGRQPPGETPRLDRSEQPVRPPRGGAGRETQDPSDGPSDGGSDRRPGLTPQAGRQPAGETPRSERSEQSVRPPRGGAGRETPQDPSDGPSDGGSERRPGLQPQAGRQPPGETRAERTIRAPDAEQERPQRPGRGERQDAGDGPPQGRERTRQQAGEERERPRAEGDERRRRRGESQEEQDGEE